MKRVQPIFDVAVVGGGHAGIEAALMGAKLNKKISLITLSKSAVGRMSCNPAVGGLAKGQMVRELDVLGGVMARAADYSGIQFKILNRSKGRSVWSPRAQVDKRKYELFVTDLIFSNPHITIIEGEVIDIIEKSGLVTGVILRDGTRIISRTTILTCGTFLNGLIHIGERKARAGRMGESGAEGITSALTLRGLVCGRLKTGTPPRLVKNSIDWSITTPVSGDKFPTPFSYNTQSFSPPNIACHTTKTGSECKQIISENLHRSPLYSGDVLGVGPRYCPSIEDKIKRFSHHKSHLLFLEPEWIGSDQIYVNGFSTSLPQDVQLNALRAVKGLENVKFFRPGYAIEYDFFPPSQLKASLESKYFSNLFFAGQINGTSGYEEAAGQGLLAGINAVQKLTNKKPLILSRGEAYLGVLINDLITKDTLEPYRMFTSRAEYRLILRFTNANRRLADMSLGLELINSEEYDKIVQNINLSAKILSALQQSIKPEEVNPALVLHGEKPILTSRPAAQLLKRPALKISDLPVRLFKDIKTPDSNPFTAEAYAEAETGIKYEGYIRRQQETIERLNKQENVNIPDSFDYISIISLSNEAREKLSFVRPENLGQAMRVSGVTPADISILSVLLHKQI